MTPFRSFLAFVAAFVIGLSGAAWALTAQEALEAWPKTTEHAQLLGQYSKATKALMVGIDAGRFDGGSDAGCDAASWTFRTTIEAYPGPLDSTDVTELVTAYRLARSSDGGAGGCQ